MINILLLRVRPDIPKGNFGNYWKKNRLLPVKPPNDHDYDMIMTKKSIQKS